MHTIIYDKNDKRHPKRKAEKDKTDAERQSQEDQERFRIGREQALAKQVLKPIAAALRTLKETAFQ